MESRTVKKKSFRFAPKEEKCRRILCAALKNFADKGFHGTSIDAIAKDARVGKATVYEILGTKEELFLATFDWWVKPLEKKLQALKDTPDEIASVTRKVLADFLHEHADSLTFMMEVWLHAIRSKNPLFIERILVFRSTLAHYCHFGDIEYTLYSSVPIKDSDKVLSAHVRLGVHDGLLISWLLSFQSFSLEDIYTMLQEM